ncbi:hypothetical protein [Thiolapillus sp.]|uniref:hypothetical protein n=1 Tax=Thiolapillus sp. TaxID=2017437 RepID=UPI0025E6FE4C|nr:hypothetical protein [Thiolapillus sp.]
MAPDNYAWAANMKRLLQETCAIVAKRQSKRLTENEYKNLQKRYRNILTRGAKQLPPIPPRQNGKRGRVAKSDAHNLWERLKKHEQGQTEGVGVLPDKKVRRGLLPHLQLPADHGKSGIQFAGRHSNGLFGAAICWGE